LNKNYRKGYKFEHDKVAPLLRSKCWLTIESRGSHGIYDIISVPPKNNKGIQNYPLLIQCKNTDYVSPSLFTHLKKYDKWQGFPLVANNEAGKVVFRSLNQEKISLESLDHG
jgi:hypothetical protein